MIEFILSRTSAHPKIWAPINRNGTCTLAILCVGNELIKIINNLTLLTHNCCCLFPCGTRLKMLHSRSLLRVVIPDRVYLGQGLQDIDFGDKFRCLHLNLAVHILAPTANKPNHYQEFSRVRTIHPGKKFATVHHFIDNCGAARGCYRTVHSNYISPLYQPIYFVDRHGNVLKKNPSLKLINELSAQAGKHDDSGVEEGSGKRRPVSFTNGKPVFGWSNASMFKSTQKKKKR